MTLDLNYPCLFISEGFDTKEFSVKRTTYILTFYPNNFFFCGNTQVSSRRSCLI